ncbi:MAG: hypothetical protein LBP40_01485 [Campylobacteraceae bacterium]|jgi:glutamyl-tRNA synthetase|nr:hypothetical protein [Campylobacteraceae bacterium]
MFFTRIAPTPSGYIHAGNALNFILTYILAKHIGAKIELRIDDIDQNRSKKEFIDDIFKTLRKLGIVWDIGAKDTDDFLQNYSFGRKQEAIFAELTDIVKANPDYFYICKCPRDKPCNGGCGALGLELTKNKTALKMRIKDKLIVTLGSRSVDLGKAVGDVTMWQKEGFASYQFASLFSDEEHGTNLIVRGYDLFNSSALQLYMAKVFGFKSFLKATFIHHPLILDEKGGKLSKTKGSSSAFSIDEILQRCAEIIGIKSSQKIENIHEILSFKNELDRYLNERGAKLEQCVGD